jgi:hypothetical protein
MVKQKDPRFSILILIAFFMFFAVFYWWAPWDPPQAGVVVSLNSTNVEILQIKKFRYGGTLFCAACIPYVAEIEVFSGDIKICSNRYGETTMPIDGSFRVGVKCPELSEFISREVRITARGFIGNELVGQTEKTFVVPSGIE